jgi:hypothetical protein
MNVRSEFRQAFRQYRKRLGLPLACPSSEIRAGELCFFNVDGTVISLGNVLDDLEERKCATITVEADIDPIISNGIRCRSLSDSERETYFFETYVVSNLVMNFQITKSMKRAFCPVKSSMSRITPFFAHR